MAFERECSRFLDSQPHLHQPGPDYEAAATEEERGEALAVQTLHQHPHLRRHRYAPLTPTQHAFQHCQLKTIPQPCLCFQFS